MKILCGYNVNIDSVYRISGAEVSALLNSFDRAEILEKINNPPGKIYSESDFIAGLIYCMKNGYGAEWLVFEKQVFEFLKTHFFKKSLVRMGGNAGIMANILSQLGASKVIPNIAVPSETQLSLFSKKAIYFPEAEPQIKEDFQAGSKSDLNNLREPLKELRNKPEKSLEEGSGNISEKNKIGESRNIALNPDSNTASNAVSNTIFNTAYSNQDPIHFVFDFSKGDTFSLYGTEITVPRENRFIATCDHLNFRLYVNPAFEKYALEHIREIDGTLISGFHLLLERYPDGSTYENILENISSQLKQWKAENDKIKIHLEFGHFASKELANSVFLKLSTLSDSIGMNEDELSMFQYLHGVPAEKLAHMEVQAVAEAAFRLASEHELKKLFIHTREFVITVFTEDSIIQSPTANFKQDSESDSTLSSKSDSGFSSKPVSSLNSERDPKFELEKFTGSQTPDKLKAPEAPDLQKLAINALKAVEFGVKCAGAYADSGRLENREFVEKEASKLQESIFGKEQLAFFLKAFNGKSSGKGAYAFKEKYLICVIPTILSRSPVTTVGLGDTLTAGTFLRGLELNVHAQT
ncbi:MAG: ADP-dependent glucokinase/phosphofructokinase [Methanosarcina sp.]